MKQERWIRTEKLIGDQALRKLRSARIAVFGLGGVGSYVCEALGRSGVGSFTLIDHDIISESNINRQLHALSSTVGRDKVDVVKERLQDINPDVQIETKKLFYLPHADGLSWEYDFVADAVDTVAAKLDIICTAKRKGVSVISSMGFGNKLDNTKILVDDIYNTSVCPLARVMRRELRARNVDALQVVYSMEKPHKGWEPSEDDSAQKMRDNTALRAKPVPASISYVPATAGLIMAGEIIRQLIGD